MAFIIGSSKCSVSGRARSLLEGHDAALRVVYYCIARTVSFTNRCAFSLMFSCSHPDYIPLLPPIPIFDELCQKNSDLLHPPMTWSGDQTKWLMTECPHVQTTTTTPLPEGLRYCSPMPHGTCSHKSSGFILQRITSPKKDNKVITQPGAECQARVPDHRAARCVRARSVK